MFNDAIKAITQYMLQSYYQYHIVHNHLYDQIRDYIFETINPQTTIQQLITQYNIFYQILNLLEANA